MANPQNPFTGILSRGNFYEQFPQTGWQDWMDTQSGAQFGSNQYNWLNKNYDYYYNNYLNDYAKQIEKGEGGEMSWLNWLSGNGVKDWQSKYNTLSRDQRGMAPESLFNARSRWFTWG